MGTLDSQKNAGGTAKTLKLLWLNSGEAFASLAAKHGLKSTTVRQALDRPYLSAERIIAEAIGVAPEEIWPERYEQRAAKRRCIDLRHGVGR